MSISWTVLDKSSFGSENIRSDWRAPLRGSSQPKYPNFLEGKFCAKKIFKNSWDIRKKYFFRPEVDIRVARELEDTESVGFRHQFKGWDNVLNIDYSKAIDTVSNKELQLKADRPKNQADMSGKNI